jgi:hypothetical protein
LVQPQLAGSDDVVGLTVAASVHRCRGGIARFTPWDAETTEQEADALGS